jgi:hypothetical protein
VQFGVVVLILACAGCDKVLGLHEVYMPGECNAPELQDELDEDGDGQLNKVDECPLVANQTTNDEDTDGAPDDCDLCPQIMSAADTGGDPDCDGIGAACDPDPALANERRFYGFAQISDIEVSESDGFVADGALHLTLTNTNLSSEFTMPGTAPAAATYEMGGTVDLANASSFWSLSMKVQDPQEPLARIELQLEKGSAGRVRVLFEQDELAVTSTSITIFQQAPAIMTFVMRATVANDMISGVVTLNELTTALPPIPITPRDPIRFGGIANHTMSTTATKISVDYYVYTTLLP